MKLDSLLGSNPQPTARASYASQSWAKRARHSARPAIAGLAPQAAGATAIKAAAEWPTASAFGIPQPHRLWLLHRVRWAPGHSNPRHIDQLRGGSAALCGGNCPPRLS